MTALVIRALDTEHAALFDTLPDPLGFADTHRRTRHRTEWRRVAMRDGRVVARGAWWGGPDDSQPINVNWFDVEEGEEEAGAELLRSAPWQVELELTLPSAHRDDPALRAAVRARTAAAEEAGYTFLVDRYLYRWTPADGLPERPGRLVFRDEPDDGVFLDALRRIHRGTLDAHALRAVAESGDTERAAREELDFFHWLPSPRSWWQVAYTPDGEPVGIHIPGHNPSGPCVAFVGVLPERRGHGYAYDLLADCTHFLAERGAEFIAAATDRGNFPMAAAFRKAGYPVIKERVHFAPPPPR
ncbi:GNAT family N-acetyltransferase [Streptomyces sp. NPDC048290]|uniref:GNAT family N-acetyltransferase n=1 Tax=Streptomyces sp. NPDC048290 TaxID=3155811 RepID=UPI003449112E